MSQILPFFGWARPSFLQLGSGVHPCSKRQVTMNDFWSTRFNGHGWKNAKSMGEAAWGRFDFYVWLFGRSCFQGLAIQPWMQWWKLCAPLKIRMEICRPTSWCIVNFWDAQIGNALGIIILFYQIEKQYEMLVVLILCRVKLSISNKCQPRKTDSKSHS